MPNPPRVNSFPGYQRISPSELRSLGLSPKSSRYRELATGEIISRRRYQERRLAALTGKPMTLEQRAREAAKGVWIYLTKGAKAAAAARRAQAAKAKAVQAEAFAAAVPLTGLTKTDQTLIISAARKESRTPREKAALYKLFNKPGVDAAAIKEYIYRNKSRLKRAA